MKWDELRIGRCLNAAPNDPASCSVNRDSTQPGGVVDDDPTDDPTDDGDDHFPPDDTTERLILKPEFANLTVGGTVQFKTYLVGVTGEEAELTSGLTYTSEDPDIASISTGGYATGLAAGVATLSVAWQNLNASAQAQVVADCSSTVTGMLLLVDVSKSMSQPMYGAYPNRLHYAKSLAHRFAGEVNEQKDYVAAAKFDVGMTTVQALTQTKAEAQTKLMALAATTANTNLDATLASAAALLNADDTITQRVIVLFSDGENNTGDDPVPSAEAFKQAGGIIVVIGCRASGQAFRCLQKISSDGLFINAISTNYLTAGDQLSASKSYYCAGNCAPAGDGCFPKPELNINVAPNGGLTRWTVTGTVDLIGTWNDESSYDLLPGHGMYLDLTGSSAPWGGKITSNTAFTLEAGVTYALRFKLAGNQRSNSAGFVTRVQLGTLLSEEYEVAWRQDFTLYEETVTGDGAAHALSFEQTAWTGSYGNLLDDIELVRLDTGEVLFRETFDAENVVCRAPACGYGTYGYGTDCYGTGCMDEPIGEQIEDVNPPADIETTSTPTKYTSSKSYTASCESGYTGDDVTRTATATSYVSQLDADTKATAEARRLAELALSCAQTGTYTWGLADYTDGIGDLWYCCAVSADGQIILAGGHDGYVVRSTNGGVSWEQMGLPRKYWVSVKMSADGQYMLAVHREFGVESGVYLSGDSGATWTDITSTIDGTQEYNAGHVSSDGVSMVVAGSATVYHSIDSGASWVASTGITGVGKLAAAADGIYVYAPKDGQLYYSDSDGAAFTALGAISGVTSILAVACSADGAIVAIATQDQKIKISTDSGVTWNSGTTGFVSVHAIDMSGDGSHILVGVDGGAKFSSDSGATWAVVAGFPTRVAYDVAFPNTSGTAVAVLYATGIYLGVWSD